MMASRGQVLYLLVLFITYHLLCGTVYLPQYVYICLSMPKVNQLLCQQMQSPHMSYICAGQKYGHCQNRFRLKTCKSCCVGCQVGVKIQYANHNAHRDVFSFETIRFNICLEKTKWMRKKHEKYSRELLLSFLKRRLWK